MTTNPTDRAARIAEIAERPDLTATVVPGRYLMAAPPFTPTPDPCAHIREENARLLSALSTADAERREIVELMREAAKYLEEMSVREAGNALESMTVCDCCRASQYSGMGILQHDDDCLVTKLRQAADRADTP